MAAAAAVCDLVPVGGRVVAPQHAYSGVLGLLDQQATTGRLTVDRVDDRRYRGRHRRLSSVRTCCGSSRRPTRRWRSPIFLRSAQPAGSSARGLSSTTPSPRRCCSSRCTGCGHRHALGDQVHRRALGRRTRCRRHRRRQPWTALELRRRSLGAIPGPMEAWLALRGLRTLALRLERAQSNAAFLAARCSRTPARQPGALPRPSGRPRPRPGCRADVRVRRDPCRSNWAVTRKAPSGSARAPSSGYTRPASAASSRCWSAAAAGPPSRRRSPTDLIRLPSASNTRTTSGTT